LVGFKAGASHPLSAATIVSEQSLKPMLTRLIFSLVFFVNCVAQSKRAQKIVRYGYDPTA
jgi:hypothetical protein